MGEAASGWALGQDHGGCRVNDGKKRELPLLFDKWAVIVTILRHMVLETIGSTEMDLV